MVNYCVAFKCIEGFKGFNDSRILKNSYDEDRPADRSVGS